VQSKDSEEGKVIRSETIISGYILEDYGDNSDLNKESLKSSNEINETCSDKSYNHHTS
jgi:hypothetical protein